MKNDNIQNFNEWWLINYLILYSQRCSTIYSPKRETDKVLQLQIFRLQHLVKFYSYQKSKFPLFISQHREICNTNWFF